MFKIGMILMCVMHLEVQVNPNKIAIYKNSEVQCDIIDIINPDPEYPLLKMDCSRAFNQHRSIKLTNSPLNHEIRYMVGNSGCYK